MSTATITQAQNKGLRHHFAETARGMRDFAVQLYVAHGGWFGQDARRAASHGPAVPAELRNVASN